MNRMSRREQIAVVGALAAAVIGLPALLISTGPARGAGSLKVQQERLQAVRRSLADVRAEANALEPQLVKRLFPGSSRVLVTRMVAAAQRASRAAGLRLDDLKPLPIERRAGLERVPVQISGNMRFPQAARLLYELQAQDDLFTVDQLRMTATKTRSDELAVELRMVGYTRPNEGEEDGNGTGS